jgi:hypothetical protein
MAFLHLMFNYLCLVCLIANFSHVSRCFTVYHYIQVLLYTSLLMLRNCDYHSYEHQFWSTVV